MKKFRKSYGWLENLPQLSESDSYHLRHPEDTSDATEEEISAEILRLAKIVRFSRPGKGKSDERTKKSK